MITNKRKNVSISQSIIQWSTRKQKKRKIQKKKTLHALEIFGGRVLDRIYKYPGAYIRLSNIWIPNRVARHHDFLCISSASIEVVKSLQHTRTIINRFKRVMISRTLDVSNTYLIILVQFKCLRKTLATSIRENRTIRNEGECAARRTEWNIL